MNVWNEEEVNKFLKLAKEDPLYIVFQLALTTRMRQGEYLNCVGKILAWKRDSYTLIRL